MLLAVHPLGLIVSSIMYSPPTGTLEIHLLFPSPYGLPDASTMVYHPPVTSADTRQLPAVGQGSRKRA